MSNRRIKTQTDLLKEVEELVDYIDESEDQLLSLSKDCEYLNVINRVEINHYLNRYISQLLSQTNKTRELNTKILEKIVNRKQLAKPKDLLKLYIENRKLENDHIKLLSELWTAQKLELDQNERDIIILYRSLPEHLKKLLYKTILEFIRTCPSMVRVINQELSQKRKE